MNKPEKDPLPPDNLREKQREDSRQLVRLVVSTLVVVGTVLIGLIYGREALLTAIPCLLGGAMLILGPWYLLQLLQTMRDKLDD